MGLFGKSGTGARGLQVVGSILGGIGGGMIGSRIGEAWHNLVFKMISPSQESPLIEQTKKWKERKTL